MGAYHRNTGKKHPLSGGIKTSNMRTGRVPLIDDNNFLWYGTISIGTPPKNFTGKTLLSAVQNWPFDPASYSVDLNTGGSDLFLASKSCNSSCSGHKEYDPSASFTSRDLGKNFTLVYEDGFESSIVNGEEYTDVVTIAGLAVRGDMSAFFLPRCAHTSHLRRRTRRLAR
jgi:cathepsin D